MPRNKIRFECNAFDEIMDTLDMFGGSAAMKKATESALKASKKHVNDKIIKTMHKSNLPAYGKYSTGDTLKSLTTDMSVEWNGLEASIDVGFIFEESGMVSIYLMYGTEHHPPVAGLEAAIYGIKTQKEITAIQEETINKVLNRIMKR